MKEYNISPKPAHAMFVGSVHRYLIWATLGAVLLAIVLSYALTRRALSPLLKMTETSKEIAEGNFSVTVPVKNSDEVGQLARSFNRMAQSLKEMESLRRSLVIDVAHELRTPLTNMRGYLEALCDEVLPPSKKTFTLLQDETLRLATLVEDVLNLARADSAGGHLQRDTVDVKAIIQKTLETFAPRFAEKSISVTMEDAHGDTIVTADANKIVRIIRNLTDNAVTYTPENGDVRIQLNAEEEYMSVFYANNSENMDPADVPYLFERFFRGEKSRSRLHGGAGIGLAIVKELIKAHGGTVEAKLENGNIRIGFTLPRNPSLIPHEKPSG